jgi:hypothetical protein
VNKSEEWKPIPGYSKYEVSNMGRVRRVRTSDKGLPPTALKNHKGKIGYAVVNLYEQGVVRQKYVHRLVAEAFLGPRPDGTHVAHWDGDGMNASVKNLRWATQSENETDKKRHGRDNYTPKGSRTFTKQQVWEMRKAFAGGETLRSIGRRYGYSHGTVLRAIQNGSVL